MIRWTIGKEHPLKEGGKFLPLAKHDGVMFGRRQLAGEHGWHAHSYPENTEEVLNIPIPNVVFYLNIGVDTLHNKYGIITNPITSKVTADRDKAAYERADLNIGGGWRFHKQVVISAEGAVQDPDTWNAAVNGVINLLRVNNDLTEDRSDLIESLLREPA
jgi:hypothetical protein